MAEYQVNCINKPHRDSPHEAISHLGGNHWKMTRLDVWQRLTSKTDQFFTQVNGRRAYLYPRESSNGTKYVQTHADNQWTNNLLSLPECR